MVRGGPKPQRALAALEILQIPPQLFLVVQHGNGRVAQGGALGR